jgi:TMEM175 potassium channel family protein
MVTSRGPGSPQYPPGRLLSLIDGVFAVAMTLLVLDLKLPSDGDGLRQGLRHVLPSFVIYLIAFASIASHWTVHHRTFRLIRNVDTTLVILSLTNLLFITLIPVTASIVGAYPTDPLATACFSADSLLYCVSASAMWSYAGGSPRLLVEEEHQLLRRTAFFMLLVAVGLAAAIPLGFVNAYMAYAIWILWWLPIAAWGMRQARRHGA